jgi:hypothetical protein
MPRRKVSRLALSARKANRKESSTMDQRTKNRIKEHAKLGHKLTESKALTTRPGQAFFRCDCGWLGWLTVNSAGKLTT